MPLIAPPIPHIDPPEPIPDHPTEDDVGRALKFANRVIVLSGMSENLFTNTEVSEVNKFVTRVQLAQSNIELLNEMPNNVLLQISQQLREMKQEFTEQLNQRFIQINEQMNVRFTQMDVRFTEVNNGLNKITAHQARTSSSEYLENVHVTSATQLIHWLVPEHELPENLPETKRMLLRAQGEMLNAICQAYGLPIGGNVNAKRQRIANHIGLVL